MNKKVVIGMSGGVDSSVAAIILQQQGYEVIGITFKTLPDFDPSDAIKVAEQIGIEHHVIDITSEFKKEIIDFFVNSYKNGLTPNPCVTCNRKIKFKYLYDALIKYNADYISTGHYAKFINGKVYKGEDKLKDQSYFLCEVDKKIIEKVIFPLENISKDEVRKIASKYNLVSATKKDSYDVCFIKGSFKSFIQNKATCKKGDVIDIDSNKVIGKHNGLISYTIGQRRGLNIGGNDGRIYVVGKDLKKNVLYISSSEEYLISTSCLVEDVNWIADIKPTKCCAKFRYRQKDIDVELKYLDNSKILVKYPQGVKSVTPGQVCAFYDGDMCLGGGRINEVIKDDKKLWYL